MSWLTNFVRPKIKALMSQKSDIPDNLWTRCPGCEQMLFHRELEENLKVCRHCGHHMRMDPESRLKSLFDDGFYTLIDIPAVPADPLKYKDLKKYTERIKDARNKTGRNDAIMVARGNIQGNDVVVAIFDFGFMGGSMGLAIGEAIIEACNVAVANHLPFIIMPASGGARMQEGIFSLMQMPRTVIAIEQVKRSKLPYITVLTDPTMGGVAASFAMLGDVAIAEPETMIGFAGPRVIQQIVREKLPAGFQRAEYLLDHGMLDRVVPRSELKDELGRIVRLLTIKDA